MEKKCTKNLFCPKDEGHVGECGHGLVSAAKGGFIEKMEKKYAGRCYECGQKLPEEKA